MDYLHCLSENDGMMFFYREAIDCFWPSRSLGQMVCVSPCGSVANSKNMCKSIDC